MNLQLLTKSNLHTHTDFADGKHTAEQVVLAAIDAGMDVLGFSEHSFHSHPAIYGMASLEVQEAYKQEIYRLKNIYADRIKILCGIEQDSQSGIPADVYDYVIGSENFLPLTLLLRTCKTPSKRIAAKTRSFTQKLILKRLQG